MLDEMRQPKALELRLLLACGRAQPTEQDEAAIRLVLNDGVDWTAFVQKAIAHGLAGLAGHTLTRVTPDMVPEDMLIAFHAFIEQTRKSNEILLKELIEFVERLAE